MSVQTRRQGKKGHQNSEPSGRPKSLYAETEEGKLHQSVFTGSSHELRSSTIYGEQGSQNKNGNEGSPKSRKKIPFKSRFLKSKNDDSHDGKGGSKSEPSRGFTSRFLRKSNADIGSPSEGRSFRSKYLSKKYGDKGTKSIENYSSTKHLDRIGTYEEGSYSWKSYSDLRTYKSQIYSRGIGIDDDDDDDDSVTSSSTRGQRRSNLSYGFYKSTNMLTSYSEYVPRTSQERSGDLKTDSSWRGLAITYGKYREGGMHESNTPTSRRKKSMSDLSDVGTTSPKGRSSTSGHASGSLSPRTDSERKNYNYGVGTTKSIEADKATRSLLSASGGGGWYSRSRRSGIAELAGDFRSPGTTSTLRETGNSVSPARSHSSEESHGRLSPANERSSRRPSTIIRRPKYQFSSKVSSRDYSADRSLARSKSYSEEQTSERLSQSYRRSSEDHSVLERSKFVDRGRPKSLYNYENGHAINGKNDTDIEITVESRPSSVRGRAASLFLGKGVSSPDLSRLDDEEDSKEETKSSRRSKEAEEARRRWRKERSKTTESDFVDKKEEKRKSPPLIVDSNIILRKPKPLYPIDDGGGEIFQPKTEKIRDYSETERKEATTASSKDSDITTDKVGGEPRRRERRERKRDSSEKSIYDQISGVKERTERDSAQNGLARDASREMPTEKGVDSASKKELSSEKENKIQQTRSNMTTADNNDKGYPQNEKSDNLGKTEDYDDERNERGIPSRDSGKVDDSTLQDEEKSTRRRDDTQRRQEHDQEERDTLDVVQKRKSSRVSPVITRRRRRADDVTKSRARPSSLYYGPEDTAEDEVSSQLSRGFGDADATSYRLQNDDLSYGRVNITNIEKPLSDYDTTTRSSWLSSASRSYFRDTSSLITKDRPSFLDKGTRPPTIERQRPKSLFLPYSEYDDYDSSYLSPSGRSPERESSSTTRRERGTLARTFLSTSSWDTESLTARRYDSETSWTSRSDTYTTASYSPSHYRRRTRRRRRKRQGSDSSEDSLPEYVPIRAIDISDLLASSDEEKADGISTEAEERKGRPEDKKESKQHEKQKEDKMRIGHKKKSRDLDSVKQENKELKSNRMREESEKTKKEEYKKEKTAEGDRKESHKESELENRSIRGHRHQEQELDSSSESDAPKYAPIPTIDLSGLLSSTDEETEARFRLPLPKKYDTKYRGPRGSSWRPLPEIDISTVLSSSDEETKGTDQAATEQDGEEEVEKKKEQQTKEKEVCLETTTPHSTPYERRSNKSKEDAKIEDLKTTRHERHRMQKDDSLYVGGYTTTKRELEPEIESYKAKPREYGTQTKDVEPRTSAVSLRLNRKSQSTVRPKSVHLADIFATSEPDNRRSDYLPKEQTADKYSGELNSFRREIDKLLNRADAFKDRSQLLHSKASEMNKSYKDLSSKVSGLREESVVFHNVFEDVESRLAETDMLGYPNTEDEWRRYFKAGKLIRKAVEIIEEQRYNPREEYFYSDSSSGGESVGDLYDLAPGIDYRRASSRFSSTYNTSDVRDQRWRTITTAVDRLDYSSSSRGIRRREYMDTTSERNLGKISDNLMASAPETVL